MPWTIASGAGFLAELRRRRVLRVLGFYTITMWMVLQVSSIVFPALNLPPWIMTVLVVAIIISYPIVTVLAWVFDITPAGIVRTEPRVDGEVYADEDDNSRIITDQPRLWVDIAIIAVLLGIVGYLLIKPGPPVATGDEPSIMVMPFADLSEHGDQAYFAQGVHAELMASLIRIPGLKVIAPSSTPVPGSATLTGSVRREGNTVRIVAQLIETDTGEQLWSETYDRSMADIFAMQNDIARAVVRGLRVRMARGGGPLVERATRDTEAYDLYLRGRALLHEPWNPDNIRRAISKFEDALRIDPRFALANAGLCSAHWEMYDLHREEAVVDSALDACHAARTRDDTRPEVHVALGWLYEGTGNIQLAQEHFERAQALSHERNTDALRGIAVVQAKQGDAETAEATMRRAIELEPDNWRNYTALGRIQFDKSRFQDALETYNLGITRAPPNPYLYNNLGGVYTVLEDHARALDAYTRSIEIYPTLHAYRNAGTFYFYLERYELARDMYLHAVELQPNNYEARSFIAEVCRFIRDGEDCMRENTRIAIELALAHLAINPGDTLALARLGVMYARLGEFASARRYMDDALRRAPDHANTLRQGASVATLQGDADTAVDLLVRARDAGFPVHMLGKHPDFSDLHEDPRFQALVNP